MFLLHLILFHLSRLHSWQYIARTIQGRPLHPTQGYVHSRNTLSYSAPLYKSRDIFWEQKALNNPSVIALVVAWKEY